MGQSDSSRPRWRHLVEIIHYTTLYRTYLWTTMYPTHFTCTFLDCWRNMDGGYYIGKCSIEKCCISVFFAILEHFNEIKLNKTNLWRSIISNLSSAIQQAELWLAVVNTVFPMTNTVTQWSYCVCWSGCASPHTKLIYGYTNSRQTNIWRVKRRTLYCTHVGGGGSACLCSECW